MYKVCQYDDFHIEYIRCYVFPTKEEFQAYILKNFKTVEVFIEKYNGWIEVPLEE